MPPVVIFRYLSLINLQLYHNGHVICIMTIKGLELLRVYGKI